MVSVSVVIPVYNGAGWIDAAISSISAQTYPHELLEIVVVDDGSTDDGAAVAATLLERSDIQSSVIRLPNGGPSRARNTGWRKSRGEWIQFLDSDDVIAPDKIRLQVLAAEPAAAGLAVIYSDWQMTRLERGEWVPACRTWAPSLGADTIASLLKAEQFMNNGSCLFRRTWLERVAGYDERHWLIEDVDLLLRLAIAEGKFQRVTSGEPLFSYRHYDAVSLSRRDPIAFHEGCLRNAVMVEDHWRARGELSAERGQLLAGIYHWAARYFAATDRRRFDELVNRIETLAPGFVPQSPALLRSVSRVVGFRRAELLSVQYRRAKSLAKPLRLV